MPPSATSSAGTRSSRHEHAINEPDMSVAAENPLLEGLRLRRRPDPCALVIFGASGDLTQRKLMPALYSLAVRRLLPERFGIVGVARTEESSEEWAEKMKEAVQDHARDDFDAEVWDSL